MRFWGTRSLSDLENLAKVEEDGVLVRFDIKFPNHLTMRQENMLRRRSITSADKKLQITKYMYMYSQLVILMLDHGLGIMVKHETSYQLCR